MCFPQKIQFSCIQAWKIAHIFPNSFEGIYGVIHLVRTHKGGRGSSISVRHVHKGEGAYTWKYVRKNVPFLHVFCDIFICWRLLPYFVVFGIDFHYCFIKHLL